MPWQWWIIWIYFKQNPFWRHNSGGKYTDWGTTWISALMGPSLLHRGNVSSLGNCLYTSRTCGSSQWTFYFDFSSLRQTHFCWQGRPTQFESSCPPFGHVFHATIFLFHAHYMWIGNIECISADEIIADEMETATFRAVCTRQHGHPAFISMSKNQSQLHFNIGNSKKRKLILFFVSASKEWGAESTGRRFSKNVLASCTATTMVCGMASWEMEGVWWAVLVKQDSRPEVPIKPVVLPRKNGSSGMMSKTLSFFGVELCL